MVAVALVVWTSAGMWNLAAQSVDMSTSVPDVFAALLRQWQVF